MNKPVILSIVLLCSLLSARSTHAAPPVEAPAAEAETYTDAELLDELSLRSFRFFWEQAGEETGLVADRAKADGTGRFPVASTASTGFALTAYCVADERGWLEEGEALERVRKTLRFIHDDLPHVHGFYYHFLNIDTGEREWDSEVSSIDTALLLAGVLHTRAYFDDEEIDDLATAIYERVDWPWMTNGEETLSMGWKPESGFIVHRWDSYSELFHMVLMAIGSPTHPLPASAWDAIARPEFSYAGFDYVQCHALFTHQYPWAWVDVDGMRDDYMNYFENSRKATLAQRQMCIEYADKFPGWGEDIWGLTSCDGPEGYRGWQGGPPLIDKIDGLLTPCAATGSIVFAPQECKAAIRAMYDEYGDQIWKHYGFVDSFYPDATLGPVGEKGWVAPDVIGIDVGITMLMIENEKDGIVWRTSMTDPDLIRALQAVNFRPDLDEPEAAAEEVEEAQPAPFTSR